MGAGGHADDLGKRLLGAGCRQGALVDARVPMVLLERSPDGWAAGQQGTLERLIVVSQDCDIAAACAREPSIEVMEVRQASDPAEVASARKGNSARLYLVKSEGAASFIADARRRMHVRKEALLGMAFEPAFDDPKARGAFARWLAGRYARVAIPDRLVGLIQRPMVRAVDALRRRRGPELATLEHVDELRFTVEGPDEAPTQVNLLVMHESELSVEEQADLGVWLEEVLAPKGGPILDLTVVFRTPAEISVADYVETIRLPLDHYSPDA